MWSKRSYVMIFGSVLLLGILISPVEGAHEEDVERLSARVGIQRGICVVLDDPEGELTLDRSFFGKYCVSPWSYDG